ncbi:hypothetical protein GN244_ATG16002 [Phytophthora infestans]|uniref:Uncharacterized protein n=1 Tax=Phytophthora infestans TaxID=4787 RepID=A0A833VWW4_PHYIN|nr:hypothetical protein GN244_ATG16002 [Phytophthora infestans]
MSPCESNYLLKLLDQYDMTDAVELHHDLEGDDELENRSPIGTTWWYNYNFSYNAYNEKIKSKQNATTNNCGEKSKFQERAGGKYTKTRITGRNEKQPERLCDASPGHFYPDDYPIEERMAYQNGVMCLEPHMRIANMEETSNIQIFGNTETSAIDSQRSQHDDGPNFRSGVDASHKAFKTP